MAARAGLLYREEALLHAHLTDTTASCASDRAGALLGTAAITGLATDQGRNTDGHGRATHRFFQIQLQGIAQVTATLSATARAAASTAEEVAEDIAEDVGEVGTTETGTAATAHLRVDPGVAVLVVG